MLTNNIVMTILLVMKSTVAQHELESIRDEGRAAQLLNPLRSRILDLAREPMSSTELAAHLDIPRQKANYHVRELARAKLLRPAGQRRKRNMIERRWVTTARSYVISPELLGPLAADVGQLRDRFSASFLLALAQRLAAEVSRAAAHAAEEDRRLSTMSIHAALRFERLEQREAFAVDLEEAVAAVIARHSSPFTAADGTEGPGRPYRLVVGCHPIPRDDDAPETPPTASKKDRDR